MPYIAKISELGVESLSAFLFRVWFGAYPSLSPNCNSIPDPFVYLLQVFHDN